MNYEYLITEYQNGMSLRQISEKHHISRNLLSKYLKSKNIEIRTQNQTSRKYYLDTNYFYSIDTEEKAYWLGVIYADGYIEQRGNSKIFGISLKIEDYAHLEKFRKALNSNYPIGVYTSKGYKDNHTVCRLLITSSEFVNGLINNGVDFNKTFRTNFPYQLPKHLQRHFIRGVFDGDGSIYVSKRDKVLGVHICGDFELLKGIVTYTSSFGCTKNIQQMRSIYDIHFTGKKAMLFLSHIYENSNVYLDRKYNVYREFLNN